jgi:RsiW-degrading membrane proteinase PrsW (M82 family)
MKIWQQVLLVLAGLFVVSLVSLALTRNPNLFPTVVILGSFAVPTTFVAFFWGNRRLSRLTLGQVVLSFLFGGVISILLAGILLPLFITQLSLSTLFLAAAIEELAKITAVVDVSRRGKHTSELNGIIIGAAVGMGFAALESAGYSFTAFLQSGGSLSLTVLVTLFRALLSPFGHGVWTAIIAGVLFLESKAYDFRFTPKVLLAFLSVSTLHWLWNSLSLIAPSPGWLIFGQFVVSVLGIIILFFLWQQAKNRQLSD